MYGTQWTEERVELLKRLHGEKQRTAVIGNIMGLSRNAVLGKLYRLGLCEKDQTRSYADRVATMKIRRTVADNNRTGTGDIKTKVRQRAEQIEKAATEQQAPPVLPFLGIPFMDLEPEHCRFPRGDDPMLFCGQPKREDSSYCAGCHAIAYTGRPPRVVSEEESQRRAAAARRYHARAA